MINREIIDVQKELLAHTFSAAQSYTNLILVAGYAGFFAIWSQLGADMTKATMFWSGLLISLSIGGFIAWEMYGMITRSRSMLGIARAVNDPERYEELMQQQRITQHDRAVQVGRAWLVALPFIAGTGFMGLIVIISAFIHGLWVMYIGP